MATKIKAITDSAKQELKQLIGASSFHVAGSIRLEVGVFGKSRMPLIAFHVDDVQEYFVKERFKQAFPRKQIICLNQDAVSYERLSAYKDNKSDD